MKRILLIGLISLINYLNLYSQGVFDLQIEASPNYSFRTFKNNSDLNITSNDESKFGYTLSLKSGFRIVQNFHIVTGLEYNNKGYKSNITYTDEQYNIIETFGTLDFIFLEIPLYLKYQFSFSNFHLSPIIGMSYGRLVGLKAHYDNESTKATKDEIRDSGFNRDVINLHVGLELRYQISEKISIKIEPKADYTVTDLYKGKDNLIISHLYIIGLNTGLIITI